VCAAAFFVFVALVSAARAHRPTESSADFRWEHGRLEAEAIFPLSMASGLLNDPELALLRPHALPEHQERVARVLADMFSVEVAGAVVRPVMTSSALTPDGDLKIVMVYDTMPAAAISVQPRFLERTRADAFCAVQVWESADRVLGRARLTRANLRISVPSPTAAPAVGAAPTPSPAPAKT
jgi:hypothetical protein